MPTKKKSSKSSFQNSPVALTDPEIVVPTIDSFLAPMLLLEGESENDFIAFRERCLSQISPNDPIEEIWSSDVVNNTWEARRLQKLKAALIHSARREAVGKLLKEYMPGEIWRNSDVAEKESKRWSAGVVEAVEYVNEILAENNLDIDTIVAKALSLKLDDIERIDKLITASENRRDAALSKLEKRRDDIVRRLQYAIATDLEFEELQAAE